MVSEEYAVLGLKYFDERKYREAIEYFIKALEIKEDKKIWYYRGVALYKLQEYDDAGYCFDRAIAIDANYKNAWIKKGDTLKLLDRYRDAVYCYKRALTIDPSDMQLKKIIKEIEYIWNY